MSTAGMFFMAASWLAIGALNLFCLIRLSGSAALGAGAPESDPAGADGVEKSPDKRP